MHSLARFCGLLGVVLGWAMACGQLAFAADAETAVAASLDWLKRQQADDGSWQFDPKEGFANPGDDRSKVKATSLALLAFLSAGQTHREGQYRGEVERGLAYLKSQAKSKEEVADLRGAHGDMSAHALATMALCEAHVMTNDKELAPTAQAGIKFLEAASDPEHGGWGGQPREPADLATTTWCFLGLKSGHMAYLNVDSKVIKSAWAFIESCRTPDQPSFGLRAPGDDSLATAMGLTCRQLLHRWDDIQAQGSDALLTQKVVATSAEFRYFAMFALRNARSEVGMKWRTQTEEALLKAQERDGRDAGSWFHVEDPAAKSGGRLQQTILNMLFLQTRFNKWPPTKHPPDDDFPL